MSVWVRVNKVPLIFLGGVSDLTWTETYPGGLFDTASFSMPQLDPGFSHPALVRGARVEILDGPVILGAGILSEPDRAGWAFNAVGLWRAGANYPPVTLDTTSGLEVQTMVPDAAVDYAIAHLGLPWIRRTSIGADFVVVDANGGGTSTDITSIGDLLDSSAIARGKRWMVAADGEVMMLTDPAAATYNVTPGTVQMASADDDYYSDLYGLYQVQALSADGVTVITVTAIVGVSDPVSAARFGRKFKVIDLTGLGIQYKGTTTSQQSRQRAWIAANLSARLAQTGGRLFYTDTIDAMPFQILRGGISVHPSFVHPGMMIRVHGVLDGDGKPTFGLFVDLVVGTVVHIRDDALLTLTPVDFTPRDFTSVLADAVEVGS